MPRLTARRRARRWRAPHPRQLAVSLLKQRVRLANWDHPGGEGQQITTLLVLIRVILGDFVGWAAGALFPAGRAYLIAGLCQLASLGFPSLI